MNNKLIKFFQPSLLNLALSAAIGMASTNAMSATTNCSQISAATGTVFTSPITSATTLGSHDCVYTSSDLAAGYGISASGSTDSINAPDQLYAVTTGTAADGVIADNSSTINLHNLDVYTNGSALSGILAQNRGIITSNGSINIDTAQGVNARGISSYSNAKINLTNISVKTSGRGSYALYTKTGGSISTSGVVNIDTSMGSGIQTYGANAEGVNAVINLSGGDNTSTSSSNIIKTGGQFSSGLYAHAGGVINITGAASSTAGVFTTQINTADAANSSDTVGVFASAAGSKIAFTGSVDIKTGGDRAYGVEASGHGVADGASVNFNDAVYIDTTVGLGTNAYGAYANGEGAVINFSGGNAASTITTNSIKTGGIQSYGMYANAGGVINVSGAASSSAGVYTTQIDTTDITDSTTQQTIGVFANGSGSTGINSAITFAADSSVSIKTGGARSFGVQAELGGVVSFGGAVFIDTSTVSGDNTIGVYADGDGSSITLAAGSGTSTSATNIIKTGGIKSYGMYANSGGVINVNGAASSNAGVFTTQIDTTDGGNPASSSTIGVLAKDASISFNNGSSVSIKTGGASSYGVATITSSAGKISTINFSGAVDIDTLTAPGNSTYGVHADGAGAVVNFLAGDAAATSTTNVIDTGGSYSYGAYAVKGGVINFTGASSSVAGVFTTEIDTSERDSGKTFSDNTIGVIATDPGSQVNFYNTTTILTSGKNSYGVEAKSGAQVNFYDFANIDTTYGNGSAAVGVYATDLNSNVHFANGVNISTGGQDSSGVSAFLGASVDINGSLVVDTSLTGNMTYGIQASGLDSASNTVSRITIVDSASIDNKIITGGDNSYGLYANSGGTISITTPNTLLIDSTVSGNYTYGIYSTDLSTGKPSSIVLSGAGTTTIQTAGLNSYGMFAEGGSSIINTEGATIINSNSGTNGGKIGVYASGVGSTIDLADTEVLTRGQGSSGVRADLGAAVNINGALVINTAGAGNNTYGLHAAGLDASASAASTIKIIDSSLIGNSISTGGDNSYALYADAGGKIDITNSGSLLIDSTSSGDYTYGLYATDVDSTSKSPSGIASSIVLHGAGSTTIQTRGVNSYGMFAEGGSSISNTEGATIINSNSGANGGKIGVYASGVGSTIDLADTKVLTRGQGSSGVRADLGAAVNINGALVINTAGDGNNTYGLHAAGLDASASAASTIKIIDSSLIGNSIATGGDNSYAVYADAGGKIDITNSGSLLIDSTSSGNYTYGLYATDVDSTSNLPSGIASSIVLHGAGTTTIQTTGVNSYAIFAEGGSSISNTEGATIINSNSGANGGKIGVYASGVGSKISLANARIITRGSGSSGIRADKSGVISINGYTDIDTAGDGDNTIGVHATDLGSLVTLSGAEVTTGGANSHGLAVDNGGTIIINGAIKVETSGDGSAGVLIDDSLADSHIGLDTNTSGSISTTGNNAHGIALIDDTSNHTELLANLTINTSGFASDALNIDPDQLAITTNISNSVFTAQQGNGITLIGGNRTININSSVITSVNGLAVSASSKTQLDLSLNNSMLNGAIEQDASSTVNLSIDANSAWNMNEDSLLQQLNNSGTISFTEKGTEPNTTLTILGDYVGNDGLIRFNTAEADDNSTTDSMIIKGSTSGTSRITVNDVDGHGAQTIDGIKLIEVDGTSNGVFSLQGRAVAGAYEYFLHQGTPTSADGNWYLRSQFNGKIFVLRPESGAYLANQNSTNSIFAHNLHQRIGEGMYARDLAINKPLNASVWARVYGYHQNSEAGDDDTNGKLAIRSNVSSLQVGSDLIKWQNNQSFVQAGVMFSGGQSNSVVLSEQTGYRVDSNLNGYALGFYATWYGATNARNEGAYVDSWLQYGSFKNKIKGESLPEETYNSRNWQASLEAGYAIALSHKPSNIWYVEPQAQLIYSNYQQDALREFNGTDVVAQNRNNINTRLGSKFYARMQLKNNMQLKPFVEVNWLHNQNSASVTLSSNFVEGKTINSNLAKNRVEARLGFEAELSKNLNLWGEIAYQKGNNAYRQTAGNIGVKYLW